MTTILRESQIPLDSITHISAVIACMIGLGGRSDMSAMVGLLKVSTLPRSARGELGGN